MIQTLAVGPLQTGGEGARREGDLVLHQSRNPVDAQLPRQGRLRGEDAGDRREGHHRQPDPVHGRRHAAAALARLGSAEHCLRRGVRPQCPAETNHFEFLIPLACLQLHRLSLQFLVRYYG